MRKYLEIEILPFFDFERMTAWAIGPTARSLNETQKMQLTAIVKERFLASMVGQLADYQGGRIQYLRPKGNLSRGKVTLGVRIFGQQRYPAQIDFKLYASRNGWKVYDVVANQTSAVAYYRKEFRYLIQRYGVDGLIEKAAKN
jgi:phospholipid transport system substrate-binding protein